MKQPNPLESMQQDWLTHSRQAEQLPGLTDADLAALFDRLPAPAPRPAPPLGWLASGVSAVVGGLSAYLWLLLRGDRSFSILLSLFTLSSLLLACMVLPVHRPGRRPRLTPSSTLFLNGVITLCLVLVATLPVGDGYTMLADAGSRADVANHIQQLLFLSV